MVTPRATAIIAAPVFLVLVLVAGLALRLSQEEKTAHDWMDHTYQVVVTTQGLLADAQAAQLALRNYQNSGRASFLGRMRSRLAAVSRDIARFRALTPDNAHQQARADRLEAIAASWSSLLRSGTATPPASPVERSRQFAATIARMDAIRAVVTDAADEEHGLLAARASRTQALEHSTLMMAVIGMMLALAILFAAVLLLLRSNVRLGRLDAIRAHQANILQATLDSIRDGLAVFETDGTLVAFNPNFFRLTGLPLSLAHPGTPLERFREYEKDRTDRLFAQSGPAPGAGQGTRQLVISDRHLDVYTTSVPDDGMLVAVVDMTARIRSEEALRQAQKMEAIGHLTGGVAHDFNNLLQIISANLDLAQNEAAGSARFNQRLENAAAAVERGSRLTGQLLAFARRQALEPRAIHLGRLVREMTDMLRRTLGEQIEIESIVSGGLWNTLIDPNQVQNALLNLAINARDAMPEGGKLTIELSNAFLDDEYAAQHAEVTAGQYVLLAVTDTGDGMPPEVLARAFDPFFTTKGEGRGTGLGLSQVYGFAKQSGGHVKIYSEVGQGTTVKMYLPRTKKAQEDIGEAADPALEGGTETVLVVEDDEDVRLAVDDMLRELGYTVLSAESAEKALVILGGRTHIDLLFSDVVMPGSLPTRELARKAREMHPKIRVLFTSGYTQNAIVHNGRLDDDVFLLSKPYRKHDLARKLRSLLSEDEKRSAAPAPVVSAAAPAVTFRKALVVDDMALIRMSTVEMVEEIGISAVEAGNAPEALRLLEGDDGIDVLVTDLGLPGMSGADLIREARTQKPALRVVVVSGYSRESFPDKNLPDDAVFLAKPFDTGQLKRAIFGERL